MAGPPSDAADSTGPPDRQTLRVLERRLVDEPLVAATRFEPDSVEPGLLVASLEDDRYPPATDDARLDVRWFTNGDFSFHYVERSTDDSRWECRWDRHPNAHDPRLHVHRPPDGTAVENLSLPSRHPLDVCSTVIAAIDQRVDRLWADED